MANANNYIYDKMLVMLQIKASAELINIYEY